MSVLLTSPRFAYSRWPWRAPLETLAHWRSLPAGRKMVVFHPQDQVRTYHSSRTEDKKARRNIYE